MEAQAAERAKLQRDFARTLEELRHYADDLDKTLNAKGRIHDRIHTLSERIEVLAEPYMTPKIDEKWIAYGMSPMQCRLIDVLTIRKGEIVSKDAILNALYFDRPNGPPEGKIVDVMICKMNKLLRDSPHRIENVFGVGYRYASRELAAA